MMNWNKAKFWPVLLAAALMAACSPSAEEDEASGNAASNEAASTHATSGLQVTDLTVSDGQSTHAFKVEIAASDEEQAKGFMFRTELGPNEGMIFPRDPVDTPGFWMKNVPIPLDIIFVAPDGRIINIAADTPPYVIDSVHAEGETGLVLELIGGRAAELGIEPGDKVEWTPVTSPVKAEEK